MNTFLKSLSFAACTAMLVWGGAASATPTTQAINESGVGSFNRIEAFTHGLDTVTMSNFTPNLTWVSVNNNPGWAVAAGDTLTNTTFDLTVDHSGSTFDYDLFAFDPAGTLIDSARFTFDGVLSWIDPLPDAHAVYLADSGQNVPEPGTILLVCSGLLGLGVVRFASKRRPRVAIA